MPPFDVEYFITITLPPKLYKKRAEKQLAIMKNALSNYAMNFFDKLDGICELTEKSNIHFHGIGIFRHHEIQSQEVTRLIFQDEAKKFSRIDVQVPEDLSKIKKYIDKDINVTTQVLSCTKKNITFSFNRSQESNFTRPIKK